MRGKVAAVWISLIIIVSSIVIVIEISQRVEASTTFYVGGSGGGNYTKIQWAIDNASSGDTVFVFNGTYYENVIVDETINLIGQDMETTIIDANGSGEVVRITRDWVNVSGFTITGSGSNVFIGGIELWRVENCVIEKCNNTKNKWGIHLYYSHNSTIRNNTCISNEAGIYSTRSHDNIIEFNNCTLNKYSGIRLYESNRNFIFNNSLNRNSGPSSQGGGVTLTTSSYNTIINNDCSDPIFDQSYGTHIESSSCFNLFVNNWFRNAHMGIQLVGDANNNTLHHNNIINNTYQVYIHTSYDNIWDDGNGEGNYWGDYTGLDDGSGGRIAGDGVGDTEIPHPFTDKGYGYFRLDNYPLLIPCEPLKNFTVLKEGWNLISIPLIQTEQDLSKVLEGIDGLYDAVQWYNISNSPNPWKHYKIGKPFGNDLNEINEIMSFWIHITQQGNTIFEYNGTAPTVNQTIQLHNGWNMVGYPSPTSHNRTVGLNNLTFDTHVDCIQWYDASTQTWYFMGPDDNFVPGRGYWVHSKVDVEWEVPL